MNWLRITACIAALYLLFTAPPVIAGDGGTRSVFAQGVGGRALAMGGAFASVADDASASIWNVGGLGWVQRKELQLNYSNLYGLGFSEQYMGLVVPHWYWGTFGLTFRHFGVTGLDRRDERNLVLEEDLTDSETEVALTYGHKIGRAWSLGAGLKLRRQSLADFSASGVGLDIGLLVRPLSAAGYGASWADWLRIGFSVRNLVEPSLRLNQDTVADPRIFQTGISYTHGWSAQHTLTVALDLESSANVDARMHGGFELLLFQHLALRGGLDNGATTAGAGTRVRNLSFDYAFEDSDIESVHRFGVSMSFGATVEERRRAAVRSEEDQLQTLLAERFALRNQQRVEELLGEISIAMESNNIDRALELSATAGVIAPDDPRVVAVQVVALQEKALLQARSGDLANATLTLQRALRIAPENENTLNRLAQVRQQRDLRDTRGRELRMLFDKGLEQLATGNLLQAQESFAELLERDPNDPDAKRMLERTHRARQARAKSLLEKAGRHIRTNQWEEAESALETARSFDPTTPEIDRVADVLVRTRSSVEARQDETTRVVMTAPDPNQTSGPAEGFTSTEDSAPTLPVLRSENTREAEEFFRRGLEAMENKRNDEAVKYWELAWQMDRSHKLVADYLSNEYVARGMEAFASGALEEAVQQWEEAVRVHPSNQRAMDYLARAMEQLERFEQISAED